jgi:ATP-dependent helicase HrpB
VRPDLRLVVMSATLDADAVAAYLQVGGDVEVLHVPGRLFPVEVEYAGDSPAPVEERVADALRLASGTASPGAEPSLRGAAQEKPWQASPAQGSPAQGSPGQRELGEVKPATASPRSQTRSGEAVPLGARSGEAVPLGDILVFLPGVREIERTMDAISRLAARHGYDVLPLHGSLDKQEQDRAVRFDPAAPPRVICATNIAETSLTLPGVRLVIDSGLVRQAGYDAARGLETLSTARISKASAEQRAGRAGRVAAGRCVRLWSKMTQHRLAHFDVPEIRRVDLAEASLAVRAWGGDPASFGWFERPDERLLAAAGRLLEMIGAVADGRLTPLGRSLQALPLHPRAARLLTAAPPALAREAATAAALLGEGAEVPGRRTADIRELLEAFERRKLDPAVGRAVERAREALGRTASPGAEPNPQPLVLEELLLMAYPDRVCRRREGDPTLARLVEGGGVRLAEPSAVRGELFLALDVRQGTQSQKQQADVRLVAAIEEAWLERDLPQNIIREEVAEWDARAECVVAVRRKRYRDLVLAEERSGRVDPAQAGPLLLEQAEARDDQLLEADATTAALRQRVALLDRCLPARYRPQELAPVDIRTVLADAVWSAVEAHEPSLEGVRRRLGEAYRARLASSGWRRLLEEHAPEAIEVPTGSRIKLDWTTDRSGPLLAVRLQELFGLADTPRVCGGTVPVVLHLLGPNYRPVQITTDLASFWGSTYPQVRKDLRARYPKHSWPENPLLAPPVRGPRRRGGA